MPYSGVTTQCRNAQIRQVPPARLASIRASGLWGRVICTTFDVFIFFVREPRYWNGGGRRFVNSLRPLRLDVVRSVLAFSAALLTIAMYHRSDNIPLTDWACSPSPNQPGGARHHQRGMCSRLIGGTYMQSAWNSCPHGRLMTRL